MLRRLLHRLQRTNRSQMQEMQIVDLDRMEAAGVTHVRLLASSDERDTPLETQLNGQRMTIRDARRLVVQQPERIPRSTFTAEIEV